VGERFGAERACGAAMPFDRVVVFALDASG